MTIIECPWEIQNIGKKTAEIAISNDDVFDTSVYSELINNFEYLVVKVPMRKPEFNEGLASLGFIMIETQINIMKHVNGLIAHNYISDYVSFEDLMPMDDISRITHQLSPNMFSTDRITLDRRFGPEIGMRRYVNWILSEFKEEKSRLVIVKYRSEEVGFMMFRIVDDSFYLLLNGLYKPWQGKHLGIITPYSPEMYIYQNHLEIEKIETSISSNNIPVVRLYGKLGFEVSSLSYVFVKHNQI